MSFITRIELLSWPLLSLSDEIVYTNFVDNSTVHGCEENILLQAITIRKKYRLKLPDAVIAATALVQNLNCLATI